MPPPACRIWSALRQRGGVATASPRCSAIAAPVPSSICPHPAPLPPPPEPLSPRQSAADADPHPVAPHPVDATDGLQPVAEPIAAAAGIHQESTPPPPVSIHYQPASPHQKAAALKSQYQWYTGT
uniref:Uncharacterized protein n=1 Tax=Leersia perrieri TaxID=77586 RepID=A0A0D9VD82_9ORYZ